MNSTRSIALLVLTCILVLTPAKVTAQAPPMPTLARLQAGNLQMVRGDVPAYYSAGVDRNVVAALASRVAECSSLYEEAAHPPIVLAVLKASDWNRLTPLPYGMPHSSAADTPPAVIIVPPTWQDAPPMLVGGRERLAKALGPAEVDRFVHLLALHEAGHIIAYGVLRPKTAQAVYAHFPFWYIEFVANYFAGGCSASRPEEGEFVRRGEAALSSVPRQKYVTLDDWDRLMTETDPSGKPYLMTEAGGLNFAAYQGLTAEMANRVHDAGVGTRMIRVLRMQWARSDRQSTDELVKDIARIVPGWQEWLAKQGAIKASASATSGPQD